MSSSVLSELSEVDLRELADLEKVLPANSNAQIKMLKHVIIELKKKLRLENEAHIAARNELCKYLADYTTGDSSTSTTLSHDRRVLAEVGSAEEKLIVVKAELASLTSKYGDLYRNLTTLRDQYDLLRKSDDEKTQKITNLKIKLEKSEQSTISMQEQIEKITESYNKADHDKAELQTENMKLRSELTSNGYINNKTTMDLEVQLAKASNELELVKEARNRLELENERLYEKLRSLSNEKNIAANTDFRRELDSKNSEIVRLSAELEVAKKECATLRSQNSILQSESNAQLSLLSDKSAYELSRLRTEYEDKLSTERNKANNDLALQAEKHSLALAAEAAKYNKEQVELKQELKQKQAEIDALTKQVGDGRRALIDLRARRQADNDQFFARMKTCKILLEEYQARLIASGEPVDPIDYDQFSVPLREPSQIPPLYGAEVSSAEQKPTQATVHVDQPLRNAVQFVDSDPSMNVTDTIPISVKSSVIERASTEELIDIWANNDDEEISYEITLSDVCLKRDLLPVNLLEGIRYVFAVVYFWDFQPLVSRAVEFHSARRQLQLGLKLTAQNLVVGQGPLFSLYLETREAVIEIYGISVGPGQLIGAARVRLYELIKGTELQTDAAVLSEGKELGRVSVRIVSDRRALRE